MDGFWLSVGNLGDNAKALLAFCGKDIRYPFWTYGNGAGGIGICYLAEIKACNLESGMEFIPFDRFRQRGSGMAL